MTERMTPPTLETLQDLPQEALWLEVGELAVHGVPLVAQKANSLINDDNATLTPEVVFQLWKENTETCTSHSSQIEGTW